MTLIEDVRPLIGVPYVEQGRDPQGWDCWGLLGWVRLHLFGKATPGWDEGFPQLKDLDHFKRAEVAESLIAARIDAWREVSPGPGVGVVFRQYERRSHVGVMLTTRLFLHARPGLGTGVDTLADGRWARRKVGFFDV